MRGVAVIVNDTCKLACRRLSRDKHLVKSTYEQASRWQASQGSQVPGQAQRELAAPPARVAGEGDVEQGVDPGPALLQQTGMARGA